MITLEKYLQIEELKSSQLKYGNPIFFKIPSIDKKCTLEIWKVKIFKEKNYYYETKVWENVICLKGDIKTLSDLKKYIKICLKKNWFKDKNEEIKKDNSNLNIEDIWEEVQIKEKENKEVIIYLKKISDIDKISSKLEEYFDRLTFSGESYIRFIVFDIDKLSTALSNISINYRSLSYEIHYSTKVPDYWQIKEVTKKNWMRELKKILKGAQLSSPKLWYKRISKEKEFLFSRSNIKLDNLQVDKKEKEVRIQTESKKGYNLKSTFKRKLFVDIEKLFPDFEKKEIEEDKDYNKVHYIFKNGSIELDVKINVVDDWDYENDWIVWIINIKENKKES